MNKPVIICLLLALCVSICSRAEVVVMQSGQTITGQIVMQNDQVIVITDAEGRKFQLPKTEVQDIIIPEVKPIDTPEVQSLQESGGNCALRLDLGGGALFVPGLQNGGSASVDLQLGTRHIGQQRIFLGGSVGYQAAIGGQLYNFLPIMLVVSTPLIDGKHAPEVGAALGYAFALKQPNKGGITAKLDLSWRYQYQSNAAMLLGIQARFQDARVRYDEVIEQQVYTSVLGKNFVSLGLRLALQF